MTGTTKVAIIQDEKPDGTNGGTVPNVNTWIVRDLNTSYDPNSIGVTISSNAFSLPAGNYAIDFSAPAFHVDEFQARLGYNKNSDFTGTTNYVYGSSQFSGFTSANLGDIPSHSVDMSHGYAVVSITETTWFRIEQSFETSPTDGGGNKHDYALGVDAHRGAGTKEIYTQVRVIDLATAVKENTTGSGVAEGKAKVAIVKDKKDKGVLGGTFQANAWRDRDLTFKEDPFNFVELYSTTNGQTTPSPGNDPGYFALQAGTYRIKFRAPAYEVDRHMAAMVWSSNESDINKAYDTLDPRDGEYHGTSEFAGNGSSFVLLPEKASTANAPVEFTGIPADATEITVMLNGVSVDGNDQIWCN